MRSPLVVVATFALVSACQQEETTPSPSRDAALAQPFPDAGAVADAAMLAGPTDTRSPDDSARDAAGAADGADEVAAFLGAWQPISGNRILNCPMLGGMTVNSLTARVNVERGAGALKITLTDYPCTLDADVAGQAATVRPQQLCPARMGKLGDGTTYTESHTFHSGNFVVSGGGATLSLAGTAQLVAGGMTVQCTVTLSGALERATGVVPAAPDAGATTPDAAPPAGGYRLTSGRYKITSYTAGSDACLLNPGSLAAAMAELPVTVDANGTMGVGNPRGTPPVPSLGQGTLNRAPGARSVLMRQNQVINEPNTTCAYGSDVISLVDLLDDDTFQLEVVERQSNRRGCPEPVGVGPQCMSAWTWRLTRVP